MISTFSDDERHTFNFRHGTADITVLNIQSVPYCYTLASPLFLHYSIKKEAAEATSKHYLSSRLLQPLKVELDRETINITVSFSILRLSC